MTSEPGASALDLRELLEELALIEAAEQHADELLERALMLRRQAAVRRAAVEQRVAEARREAPPPERLAARPSRRPRLEEGDRESQERYAQTVALLRRNPGLSDRDVARRAGVHRDVVARVREELYGVAEKVAEKSPQTQQVAEKGSAGRRRS